jgi:sugar phosphate isomerase/epimerase
MFLHYIFNKKSLKDCYNAIPELVPDHLHISNTYFKQESLLASLMYLLRGDTSSAFVKLIGDFHLPLYIGHINYNRIFRKLKVPETVIMEISSRNYELLMRRKLNRRKSSEELVKKGYLGDVRYFKKLLKTKKKKIFINTSK